MEELTIYRSRVGVFAGIAYRKSALGKKPKRRRQKCPLQPKQSHKVLKQAQSVKRTKQLHCHPEIIFLLLFMSSVCFIERHNYFTNITNCIASEICYTRKYTVTFGSESYLFDNTYNYKTCITIQTSTGSKLENYLNYNLTLFPNKSKKVRTCFSTTSNDKNLTFMNQETVCFGRTCLFLLGNKGCHMYTGNPGRHTSQYDPGKISNILKFKLILLFGNNSLSYGGKVQTVQ